jgi:hypothetical protein
VTDEEREMAKKKAKETVPEEEQSVGRAFLTVNGVGILDPKGKVDISFGLGRHVAPPDKPLVLIHGLLAFMVESRLTPYSSRQAALKDIGELAVVITSIQQHMEKLITQEEATRSTKVVKKRKPS